MSAQVHLSEGSLRTIMRGGEVIDPVMQVLSSKRVTGTSDSNRYRILLSDGKYLISFAILTTQSASKEVVPNTVIKIKRYITSVINNTNKASNKRILIILEMETLVSGEKVSRLGNPEPLPEDDMKTTSNESGTTNLSASLAKPTAVNANSFHEPFDSSATLQDQLIHPISSLSPYQNRWVIKARVTNKSSIRKWSNSRGEGQLFSIDLLDETGEIRAVVFQDMVDKYYDMIEVDKVYYISKCILKIANKQYSTIKNDYEMNFTNETIIQECHDSGVSSVPKTQYDFTSIDKIAHIEVGTTIDVIGVCKSSSDLQTFQARSTGRELRKREVILVDKSKCGIALTLWGDDAEKFDGSTLPIVAIKGAKVGEFGGGKNLSVMMNSIMKINPDIPQSHQLRGWFDNEGSNDNVINISARTEASGFQTPWMTFKDAQEQSMGRAEKGDYFQAKGTVLIYRSENSLYKACPLEECNKKVIDLENGMYRCEKCNREYPNFKYRLLGSVHIADWTGSTWVSLFASEAEKMLGKTSQEVGEASELGSSYLSEITDNTHFKQFMVKCRAKMENYNDETRLKISIMKVEPVNYKEYNKHLISRIETLLSSK